MRANRGDLKMQAVNLSGVNGKKKTVADNTSGRNYSTFAKWGDVLAYFPTIHFFSLLGQWENRRSGSVDYSELHHSHIQ